MSNLLLGSLKIRVARCHPLARGGPLFFGRLGLIVVDFSGVWVPEEIRFEPIGNRRERAAFFVSLLT